MCVLVQLSANILHLNMNIHFTPYETNREDLYLPSYMVGKYMVYERHKQIAEIFKESSVTTNPPPFNARYWVSRSHTLSSVYRSKRTFVFAG